MTLRHANRIRKNGGKHMLSELELADAFEMADNGPFEDDIRQRARGIRRGRYGGRGRAALGWFRTETKC